MSTMGETKTNRFEDTCTECCGLVAPGRGECWWQAGPDDGGDVTGRTPEGWRVTHLDKTECDAEKARRSEERRAQIERGAARAAEQRAQIDARRAEAEAPVRALIAELALVAVPERCNLCETALPEIYRASYSDGPGFSGERTVIAWRDGDEAIVSFRSGNFATHYASAAICAKGIATYRVQKWFREGSYGAESYPGPAVPREELSEEELNIVDRLEAKKAEAKLREEARIAKIRTALALEKIQKLLAGLTEKTAATLSIEIEMGENNVTVVTVSIPEKHWFRGKLRAPIAKLLPRDGFYGEKMRFITQMA